MSTDPNSFEAFKSRLSAETLKDIEGLDPIKYGFAREECCGPIPEKLPGSMGMDKEHLFLVSSMHANDWDKRTQNVPGFNAFHANVNTVMKTAGLTVASLPPGEEDSYVLRFRLADGRLQVTQYSFNESGAIPWMTKGTLAVDRSNEVFLFVCSHRTRDARCGFCGFILIDLLRQDIKNSLSAEVARRVHVMPCSHVGGHIYAGNVIAYSQHGGVGFGLFMPSDVDALVATIGENKGLVPESLKNRIRGEMVGVGQASRSGCTNM